MKKKDLRERFAAKTKRDEATGCLEWTGALVTGGYGVIKVDGVRQKAHRVAWELAAGKPVPAGLVVRHRCDTPACVSADHLAIGTQADNMADKMRAGHQSRGPRDPLLPALTASDRNVMLWMDENGMAQAAIAEIWSVTPITVNRAIKHARQARAVTVRAAAVASYQRRRVKAPAKQPKLRAA